MADEEKGGKSTLDLLKDAYDFFVPKKTSDSDNKMSKKEKDDLSKDIGNLFAKNDLYESVLKSIDTKNQNVKEGTYDNGDQAITILRNNVEMATLRFENNGTVTVQGLFFKKSMDNISDVKEYLNKKGIALTEDKQTSKTGNTMEKKPI